jgi:predicted nucleotidyltransferase
MNIPEYRVEELIPAWKTVLDIVQVTPKESWLLVGGLMTQVHAGLHGYSSRATEDVDVLVDIMANVSNASTIISSLKDLGFEFEEPMLRGSAFHRMRNGSMVVDILVEDHLHGAPQRHAKVSTWPMMEVPGGHQAIERRMDVLIHSSDREAVIEIPNLLGAIVLKSAAWKADNRDTYRHLEDVALLCSLADDLALMRASMHGSDKKRITAAATALADPNEPAWLKLDPEMRIHGMDVLRILTA